MFYYFPFPRYKHEAYNLKSYVENLFTGIAELNKWH